MLGRKTKQSEEEGMQKIGIDTVALYYGKKFDFVRWLRDGQSPVLLFLLMQFVKPGIGTDDSFSGL